MGDDARRVTIWRPQAGPQKAFVDCPCPEVFFGGARGGGKTDGVLGKWAIKERRYGAGFNAVAFRRTSVSFEDAVERAKQLYIPLGARFTEKPLRFRMPNGGKITFAYLENEADAEHYQGRNLSDAWVEEAGQYPTPGPIEKLFGVLRSAGGVPVQLTLTANPGGAGQHWLKERYKLYPFPQRPQLLTRILPNGQKHSVAVIPSRITDNHILLANDPGYVGRLHLVGSQARVRAWLEGDWSAIEDAFFAEWSQEQHVLQPFEIPPHWHRFRSGDWGSARPFSVGWWAVVSDDYIAKSNGGDRRVLPRGALVRYREWYGSSAPNVGLKLTAEEVAAGIKERERSDPRNIQGVLDPAAFTCDGGPSIAERMASAHDIFWSPADNARVARNGAMGGWDQVRARLRGTARYDESARSIDWASGHPMLYVFSTCRDLIRTLPVLQHDKGRPEDVDTDMEDHAPDELRYACMSRPYIRQAPDHDGFKRDSYRESTTELQPWDSALTI